MPAVCLAQLNDEGPMRVVGNGPAHRTISSTIVSRIHSVVSCSDRQLRVLCWLPKSHCDVFLVFHLCCWHSFPDAVPSSCGLIPFLLGWEWLLVRRLIYSPEEVSTQKLTSLLKTTRSKPWLECKYSFIASFWFECRLRDSSLAWLLRLWHLALGWCQSTRG